MAPEPAAAAGHLLVLVHGLWGVPQQLRPLGEGLAARLTDAGGGGTKPVVLLSKANALVKSREGIEACAGRLAEEVRAAVAGSEREGVPIEKISFIGHSLGGLISRRAIAMGHDEPSGKVFGATPQVYSSIATPHLGAGNTTEVEVPVVDWLSALPVVGGALKHVGRFAVYNVANSLYGKSGQEVWAGSENDPEAAEVLLRLADAAHLASLGEFRHRVVYSSAGRDHVVPWASSRISAKDELPAVPRGDDPLAVDAAPGGAAAAAGEGDGPTISDRILATLRGSNVPFTRVDMRTNGVLAFTHRLIANDLTDGAMTRQLAAFLDDG